MKLVKQSELMVEYTNKVASYINNGWVIGFDTASYGVGMVTRLNKGNEKRFILLTHENHNYRNGQTTVSLQVLEGEKFNDALVIEETTYYSLNTPKRNKEGVYTTDFEQYEKAQATRQARWGNYMVVNKYEEFLLTRTHMLNVNKMPKSLLEKIKDNTGFRGVATKDLLVWRGKDGYTIENTKTSKRRDIDFK